MARAAYSTGDAAAAERFAVLALEQWKSLQSGDTGGRRDEGADQILAALVLLRQGRNVDARVLVSPCWRCIASCLAGTRAARRGFKLEQALIAATAAGLGDPRAQRAEAARMLDGLPEEMRETSDVKFWRARLAEVAARS